MSKSTEALAKSTEALAISSGGSSDDGPAPRRVLKKHYYPKSRKIKVAARRAVDLLFEERFVKCVLLIMVIVACFVYFYFRELFRMNQ